MTPTPEPTMPVRPEHDPARLLTPEQRKWLADNIIVNPHAGEPIRFEAEAVPEEGLTFEDVRTDFGRASKRRIAEFDKAIAAHDAQVAEKAWDEGYTAGTGPYGRHRNPYARTERDDA